jgi:hypothetical protein
MNFKLWLKEEKGFPEPWTRAVKRQYGAEDLTTSPKIVVNQIILSKNNKKYTILAGTSIQKLSDDSKEDDLRDPKKTSVRIKVLSNADPDNPLMSATAHGQPSEAAGQEFVVSRETYLWMIQPGQPPTPDASATAPPSPQGTAA